MICGSEEGSLTVWDLRNPVFPASYLKALESLITDVAFHHTDPTKLFAASDGGDLFQWNHKTNEIAERIEGKSIDSDNVNPWLCGDRTKNKVVVRICDDLVTNVVGNSMSSICKLIPILFSLLTVTNTS